MIRTESKQIGKIEYCIYCGNKSKHDVDYYSHGREEDHYETCDCKGLEQLKERQQVINNMQRELDNFVKDLKEKANIKLRGLQYEADLKELKERYGR